MGLNKIDLFIFFQMIIDGMQHKTDMKPRLHKYRYNLIIFKDIMV